MIIRSRARLRKPVTCVRAARRPFYPNRSCRSSAITNPIDAVSYNERAGHVDEICEKIVLLYFTFDIYEHVFLHRFYITRILTKCILNILIYRFERAGAVYVRLPANTGLCYYGNVLEMFFSFLTLK